MKKIVLLSLLLLLLFTITGCAEILEKYNTPVDVNDTEEIVFTIPSGASTTGIGNLLLEDKLIQNLNAFKAKVKSLGVDGQMKAGDYKLSKSMTSEEIINKIVDGDIYVDTNVFTIPEGYEIRQIVDKLVDAGIVDREVFMDTLENATFDYKFLEGIDRSNLLEGFLFPDTYTVTKTADEYFIVNMMLARFDEVFVPEYYLRAKELGMSINEVVTLASIIEREAKIDEEFPIVSSVFHNRIDNGMLLQSCATVQYVLKERKDRLLFSDLEIDSPFNTYMYTGLTPAPIASPGALAIKSALYPEDTKYLYFVTKENNDGSHYFNETLEGHNRDAKKGN